MAMIPQSLNNKKSAQINVIPIKPISIQQSERLFKQLQAIKYPITPVSQPEELKLKIKSFKQAEIQVQLQKMLVHCNSYRQVRGDGNCFFRAIGFAFLTHLQKNETKDCFPELSNIQLTSCKPQSIPKNFRQFYDHRFLKETLNQNWSKQLKYRAKSYEGNYSRALARLLSDFPYFDFIIILYFRAVCLKAFKNYAKQMKQYLQGDQQDNIRTYGQESEGVVLDICNQHFKISIEVFEIRKKQVKSYKYDKLKTHFCQVSLLYFQNHYDLIEKSTESQIKAEKSQVRKATENMDIQYFSEISENILKGSCIECNKQGLIYEESGLCKSCHDMNINSLANYSKDKLITAYCTQCRYKCPDVSEQLRLCKDCIKYQSNYAKKQQYKKNYCQSCKDQIKEPGKCSKCLGVKTYRLGICLQCNHTEKIQTDLGICDYCTRIQQRYADQAIERSNRGQKKTCQGCSDKSYTLNQLSLCKKCSEKTKDDTVQSKIRRQATKNQRDQLAKTMPSFDGTKKNQEAQVKNQDRFKITQSKLGENICKLCRKKVKDEKMRDQICQNCFKLNKQKQAQAKVAEQGKVKEAQSSILASSYQIRQQYRDSNIRQTAINSAYGKCKRCAKQKNSYDLMQGYCKPCRSKFPELNQVKQTCKYCPKDSTRFVINNQICSQCKQKRGQN